MNKAVATIVGVEWSPAMIVWTHRLGRAIFPQYRRHQIIPNIIGRNTNHLRIEIFIKLCVGVDKSDGCANNANHYIYTYSTYPPEEWLKTVTQWIITEPINSISACHKNRTPWQIFNCKIPFQNHSPPSLPFPYSSVYLILPPSTLDGCCSLYWECDPSIILCRWHATV